MDKVAIITGASAGIGLATAKLFIKNGYKVYNLSRHSSTVGESVCVDVSNREKVFQAINEIFNKEGHIDVLMNSAGMGISGSVEDTSEDAAKKIFDINYFGTLYCIQATLPYMRKNGSGPIINLSSVGAPLSLPFQSFYSATKSAVTSLTEALRIEVKPFNIKVTEILPGDVKTEFTSRREKNKSNSLVYGDRINRSVLKMEKDEQNGMSPDIIAKIALKLANKKNPPIAVVGGFSYKAIIVLIKFLPKRAISYIIQKLYG
ncbi:MAG: SDR family oxidoreductase [Clostridia bacterium]